MPLLCIFSSLACTRGRAGEAPDTGESERLSSKAPGPFTSWLDPDEQGRPPLLEGLIFLHKDARIITRDPQTGRPARLRWAFGSIEAESIVYFPDQQVVYAEGARMPGQAGPASPVRMRMNGILLLTDSLHHNLKTGRGAARGVKIYVNREALANARPRSGAARTLPFGTSRVQQVVLAADSVEWTAHRGADGDVRQQGEMIARNVRVTTCEFDAPHWHLRSRTVRLRWDATGPRDLHVKGNWLHLGRRRFLPLPGVSWDLARPIPLSALDVKAGNSSDWGQSFLTHVELALGKPERPRPLAITGLEFDGDFREERGFGGGIAADYRTGASGQGRVRHYYVNESLISAADDADRALRNVARTLPKLNPLWDLHREQEETVLERERYLVAGPEALVATPADLSYADRSRFALEAEHRSVWGERPGEFSAHRLDLLLELSLFGDRDYRHEYEERILKREKEPETQAVLHYGGDDLVAEVLGRWRVNEFVTRTEYLPEARFHLPGFDLGGGFLLTAELFGGHLRKRYDEGVINRLDFDADRLHTLVQISRPFHIGPIRFNNYIGTQQTYYSSGRAGEDFWQGALLLGAEVSTRLYGVFGGRGANGTAVRHIIEPRIRYVKVYEPTHDPVDVYDFDAVDNRNETDVVTFSLDQKLQVRRRAKPPEAAGRKPHAAAAGDADYELRTVAALEASVDLFANDDEAARLNEGDKFDALRVAGLLAPSRWMALHANATWNLQGDGVEEALGGVTVGAPDGSWMLGASIRSTRERPARNIPGASMLALRYQGPLWGRWRLGAVATAELEDSAVSDEGFRDVGVVLTRVFHDWQFAVRVTFDEDEDDTSVSIQIKPRGASANLRRRGLDLMEIGAFPADAYGRE